MEKLHPLEQIIRQIDKAEASAKYKANSDEIVIIFDQKKKCFLSRIPIFSGNNIVYYLVYNTNNASSFAESRDLLIEVTDFARNRKLGISLDYRASCPSGKEEQVALALCGDNSPGDELDKRIKRWVFQLTDERATEFIDNYYTKVEWLQTELKTKAAEEIGLKLDVRLSVENSKQLEPIKIEPTEITVEVTDFAKDRKLPISVAYRASCLPGKENQVAQALCGDNSPGDEFDKIIKGWVFQLTDERAAEFIDNYYSQVKWLQTELKTKAAEEIGLNLDVRLSVENSKQLEPIKIEPTEITVEVTDFAKDRKLPISVAYRASCLPGKENQVAQALCGDNSPGYEFDKRIKRWVFQLTDERAAEFIDNYYSQVEWLQNELKTKAAEEIGLNLDVRLSLKNRKQLEPVKIGLKEIPVYVKDSDNLLDLEVETELIVHDQVKATSNLDYDCWNFLTNLTKREIQKYLRENTTISKFYYELKDTVRHELVNHLNSILDKQGLRVGYLFINSKTVSSSLLPKELVEIQYRVECKVQKYAGSVYVENNLQMLSQDFRRYISAQSPNLQGWVETKLEKIVKPLLLDKNYADILCDFSQEAEAIRQAMQIEAESIGYRIKHIVSVPKQEHSQLLEKLEIKDDTSEFSTNLASIKVTISTTVDLKFISLKKIEDYLNKTVDDIKELIKETINRTTRVIIRTIDPERFYMRFFDPKSGEKSVEQELKDEITQALEEQFGAQIIRVDPITEQTEIMDYVNKLMGEVGSFECEVLSLTGGEPVTFQGDFKILGIEPNSWYTFQLAFPSMRQPKEKLWEEHEALKNEYSNLIKSGDVGNNRNKLDKIHQIIDAIKNEYPGINKIKISIENSITAKLETAKSELLRYTDFEHLSTMESYINQWARESVIEQYGLEIKITNLSRSRTQEEKSFYEAKAKLQRANLDKELAKIEAIDKESQQQLRMYSRRNQAQSEELNKLYEQRAKIIANSDVDQDEIDDLNEKINRLENEIPSFSLEDAGNSINRLEPTRDKRKSALDFEEQMSLPSSEKNQEPDFSGEPRIINQEDEII
ncbi:hypothetical protein [Moorena sp. SIO3H5]|uniref:hypothetical protein n=1 Tax=Moorena sp. SIO3H5 TaxID=2607834 RepID=UPI0013B9B9FF|nr:hypothetical protein [Moorena sp. SIO3H5]NEO73062.1 hypothetical protein [Moorena sp. SIO3H5]